MPLPGQISKPPALNLSRMKNRTARIIFETLICAAIGAIFGAALGFAF
jgi:hypothetical protein